SQRRDSRMPFGQDPHEQAAFDLLASDIGRQSSDPEGASGDLEGPHVVALQTGRVRNGGFSVDMPLVRKRPEMRFLGLAQADAVVRCEIIRLGRRAFAGEVSAACEQVPRDVDKVALNQTGGRERYPVRAQANIESLLHRIDESI